MSVSVVVKNGAFTIGEGPHWDEASQSLLYVDIQAGDVHRWNSVTGEDTKVHLDGTVSFVVPRRSGGYIVGLNRTLSVLDWDSAATTTLHEVELKGTRNRFNDGKCDPSGRLWAGTMGHKPLDGDFETQMGSLFSLNCDNSLRKHVDKVSISNGMAWTSDNRVMYYIDTVPRKVYAFDFDINTGNMSNQRVAMDFGKGAENTRKRPDGCCIDTDGKLWVACFGAGSVIQIDPLTGQELRTVTIPASQTTSCCFGGPNYDELYVTTGNYGISEEEFKTKQPLAGSVFRVTGLGAKGAAPCIYGAC